VLVGWAAILHRISSAAFECRTSFVAYGTVAFWCGHEVDRMSLQTSMFVLGLGVV
jgi:hypothetical protein